MRGPKPQPTTLKLLRGNPGKRPLNEQEPTPPDGMPECPEFLDAVAKAAWERTAAMLKQMGVLTVADGIALSALCTLYSRWVHAEEQVKKFGAVVKNPDRGHPMKSPYLRIANESLEALRKLLLEFGLTPSSRSRIHAMGASPEDDEFERFLAGG